MDLGKLTRKEARRRATKGVLVNSALSLIITGVGMLFTYKGFCAVDEFREAMIMYSTGAACYILALGFGRQASKIQKAYDEYLRH